MQPDFLSQLHDIQTPEEISWWPLAWGWYAVILLALLVVGLTIYAAVKYWQKRRFKRIALKQLKNLDINASPRAALQQVNDILKRVVMTYATRDEVASLSGQRWANWLQKHSKKGPEIDPTLLSLIYQPDCNAEQVADFRYQVSQWLSNNLPLNNQHTGGKHV